MRRASRMVAMLTVSALGVGLALLVGTALAKTFSLQTAKGATVTNFNTHKSVSETIAVAAGGGAVYTLSGDSKSHPECTKANGCFGFWPPVTVHSTKHLTKAAGIKGKLGTWRRDGFVQLTLAGHPLYFFANDKHKHDATGEAVNSFGGIWHVIALSGGLATTTPQMPTTPTPNPTPTPTPTTPTTPTYP